jgi:plastocyanin
MNTYFKYYLMLISVVLFSCEKYQLDDPALEVTADKTTIKAGESVTFKFEGNPQMLSFYSGEFLKDYNYVTGSRALKNCYLSFSSATVATIQQANQLAVLVSADFDGKYAIANIKAATWVDITNRFTLATNATVTASTEVDIMDLAVAGKPLYLSFRYITKPQTEFLAANDWNITAVLVKSKFDDAEVTLMDYGSGSNFSVFSYGNKQAGRSLVNATTIQFKGNATAAIKEEYTEDWGISRAIYINPNDLGKDKATALKLFREAKKESYTYTYSKAGTYTATFIAETNNVYGNKKVVRQIEITVTN